MRVICTIPAGEEAKGFSSFLRSKGIPNECEEVSLHGKEPFYRIWVIDEDQVDEAQNLFHTFKQSPQEIEAEPIEIEESPTMARRAPPPFGILSKLIIVTTILIFLWSAFHKGISMPPKIPGIVEAPVLKSIMKDLVFDYPKYFELRDELITIWPAKEKEPSAEALVMVEKIKATPYWMGIYDRFIRHVRDPSFPLSYSGPMFEKISQGEVWRLFTPALLHYDLLHIFFNLLWFVLLGNQIETRVGKWRFSLLILTSAIASNVSQYLMSGSFFMGLSGVVVALAAFIWARQQVAPWEGYLLQRVTLIFLGIFIFGIFGLQVVFFFLQVFSKVDLTVQIANTAHLVGGVVGYLFGRMKFFALRNR